MTHDVAVHDLVEQLVLPGVRDLDESLHEGFGIVGGGFGHRRPPLGRSNSLAQPAGELQSGGVRPGRVVRFYPPRAIRQAGPRMVAADPR